MIVKLRRSVNIRGIFPRSGADLKAELDALGCSPDEVRAVSAVAPLFLKIDALSVKEAKNLSRIAHSIGDGCTAYIGGADKKKSSSSAIVLLRKDQINAFCGQLRSKESNLQALANRIEALSAQDLPTGRSFAVRNRTYFRTVRPFIMGILNVTPDSFSDGGRYFDSGRAFERGIEMAQQGADFIDVGGESSRPGAEPVSEDEEVSRVIPLIKRLAAELEIPISIDTTKAAVAKKALEAGAQIVNDISALRWDADMAKVVADSGATLVLMHMKGDPRSMQKSPYYDDLMSEVHGFLKDRVRAALETGIPKERILVDPGIGFGKRLGDNFELLGRLQEFRDLGAVAIGPSRKSFIGYILNLPVEEREWGTAGAVAVAAYHGADVIRVHDVEKMLQVARIAYQCRLGTARESRS